MTVGTGNGRRFLSRFQPDDVLVHGIHSVKESVENEMVVVKMFFYYTRVHVVFFFTFTNLHYIWTLFEGTPVIDSCIIIT